MATPQEMLKKWLTASEQSLLASMNQSRAVFTHPGNKGDDLEARVRSLLARHLPRRLMACHGEVIDRNLNRSNQCDIVMINEQHPLLHEPSEPGLFVIEGVCAAGEVKSVLTSDALGDILTKARAYKQLRSILPAGAMFYGAKADRDRYGIRPPFFAFCAESQLSLNRVYQVLCKDTRAHHMAGDSIDAIFMLGRGCIYDLGKGDGSFVIADGRGGSKAGWTISETDEVLFQLITWLSCVMPIVAGGQSVLVPYLVTMVSGKKAVNPLNRPLQDAIKKWHDAVNGLWGSPQAIPDERVRAHMDFVRGIDLTAATESLREAFHVYLNHCDEIAQWLERVPPKERGNGAHVLELSALIWKLPRVLDRVGDVARTVGIEIPPAQLRCWKNECFA